MNKLVKYLFLLFIFLSSSLSYGNKSDKFRHFNAGINYIMSMPYQEKFKQQNFRLSHGAGIYLRIYNDRGWGFSSGINYNTVWENYYIDNAFVRDINVPPGTAMDTSRKIYIINDIQYFLEMPLLFNYTFSFKGGELKIDFGCTTTFIIRDISRGTIDFLNGNIINFKNKGPMPRDRFCFYPTLNIGFEKRFKDYGVFISPSIRYGFFDNSKYDWLIGAAFGFYKSFG